MILDPAKKANKVTLNTLKFYIQSSESSMVSMSMTSQTVSKTMTTNVTGKANTYEMEPS